MRDFVQYSLYLAILHLKLFKRSLTLNADHPTTFNCPMNIQLHRQSAKIASSTYRVSIAFSKSSSFREIHFGKF